MLMHIIIEKQANKKKRKKSDIAPDSPLGAKICIVSEKGHFFLQRPLSAAAKRPLSAIAVPKAPLQRSEKRHSCLPSAKEGVMMEKRVSRISMGTQSLKISIIVLVFCPKTHGSPTCKRLC